MSNNVKVHFFTQDGSKCIRIIRFSDISKEACEGLTTPWSVFDDDSAILGKFQVQPDAQWKPDAISVSALQVYE